MQGMSSVNWASGWSDDGWQGTHEWLIDPAFIVAESIPYYDDFGGAWSTGIAGWRQRPDPNGPETVTDHNNWLFWPGCAYIDNCSSVTFAITVAGRHELKTVLNLYFW